MASTAEPVPAPPAEATTTPNPSPPAPSTGSPPATDPEAATKQEAPAVTEAAVPEHEAETAEGGDDAKDWHNGLFGCFGDLGTCAASCFCPCILDGRIAERLKKFPQTDREHLFPVSESCIVSAISIPCTWSMALAQRRKVREHFGIEGSTMKDWLTAFFCFPCVRAQTERELKDRATAAHPPPVVEEEPPAAQPGMEYAPPAATAAPAPDAAPSEKPAEPAEPAPAVTSAGTPPADSSTETPAKAKGVSLPPLPGIVTTPAQIH